jgi:ferredoxin
MMQINDEVLYRKLGEKIDSLPARAPWNETFHRLLKDLYSREEADVVVGMHYSFATLDRISRITGVEPVRLRGILDSLCLKGLVLDLWNEKEGRYYYMPWPLVVGIFEFTMMRTGDDLNTGYWARLFKDYFPSLYSANFSGQEKMSVLRVIPVEETIRTEEGLEFLDHERASFIVDSADRYAMGICSCRNEKEHLGERSCDSPLDNCSLFGFVADYAIRRGLAREVSKQEMLENVERSRELGLVLCSYNTRKNPFSICHCCTCCCNFLAASSKFGFTNAVVTSNYIASFDQGVCKNCGKCAKLCPIGALSMVPGQGNGSGKKGRCAYNEDLCVGCGVCVGTCPSNALVMKARAQKVVHPETLFETVVLGTLERGTMQNLIFDNPRSSTQQFLRTFVGAFLRLPPVKKTLMSEAFRSSFLSFMNASAAMLGKGWITRL